MHHREPLLCQSARVTVWHECGVLAPSPHLGQTFATMMMMMMMMMGMRPQAGLRLGRSYYIIFDNNTTFKS